MLTSVNKNYLKLTPCPKTWNSFSISQNWNEKGSPALSTAPLPRLCHCLQQLPRKGPLTELAIPFGAWLKYPHVRNILNIYKDISKNALGMFCCCCRRVHPHTPRPLAASVSRGLQFRRHSLFVECFAHFLVERPKGKFNFKCGMRAALLRAIRAKSVGVVRCGGRCGALWMGCGTWARVSF